MTSVAAPPMPMPDFGFVTVHATPLADGVDREAAWMAHTAETGRAAAHLWHAPPGLVVPRSYERLPHFAAACAASAADGWPVQVRASGGGLVPQGPGLLALSLVWCSARAVPSDTDAVYGALCDGVADALAQLGVAAVAQAVDGSFCDGRFNLAAQGRKLVGTAQSWRRVGGVPVVLAHAVIVVDADPAALTERANAFEAAAGGTRRYRTDALTSVAQAWCFQHGAGLAPADLHGRLTDALARRFARAIPPLTTPKEN